SGLGEERVGRGGEQAGLAAVEPTEVGLEAHHQRVGDELGGECRGGRSGSIGLTSPAGLALAPGEQVEESVALVGDDVERVVTSVGEREQDLEDQLVAGRRLVAGDRRPPAFELGLARGREPIDLLTVGLVHLDTAVALEAVERRVHLADVERPGLARRVLERGLQLEPVGGTLAEQGEESGAYAHILSMHTEYGPVNPADPSGEATGL